MSDKSTPISHDARRKLSEWLLCMWMAGSIAAVCSGCGAPLPARPDGEAAGSSPPMETDTKIGNPASDGHAAPHAGEEKTTPKSAVVEWRPSEELAAKLTEQPEEIGAYQMRVPLGFHALVQGTDALSAQPSQLYVFESPAGEGVTTSVVSATIHAQGQNTPSGDQMLSAFFANMAARLPDFERGQTEQGQIDGLKASRATYKAAPPVGPPIQGVVYFVDDGADLIVLQGIYKQGTPDCDLELLDASLRSFHRRASPGEP